MPCADSTQPLGWHQTSLKRIKRENVIDKASFSVLLQRHLCINQSDDCIADTVCASDYMALRVYHNCIQMMLIGLVHPLKETEALFASDIKEGSERGGLLQS